MKEDLPGVDDYRQIKLAIETIVGREIRHARQCKDLADLIEKSTGRLVSIATLRRFFQLMKSTSNPSRYTLETLSIFIEKQHNKNDNRTSTLDDYTDTKKYCDALIAKSTSNFQFVNELLNHNYTRVSLNPKLRYLLEKAVQEGDTDLILSFYQNQKALTAQTDFYKMFGAVLNAHPDKSLKILEKLSNNEVVRLNFYENFVNTGNFKVYHHWLHYYKLNEESPEKILWADAILIWGQLLSKKKIDWRPFILSFQKLFSGKEDAHPMLKARVYGLALFCEELKEEAQNQVHKLLASEIEKFEIDHTFTPFASLLITQYLLLADQKVLLEMVAKNLKQPTFSTEYIVKSIPFFSKLINAYLYNEDSFEFDEVLMLQSGFTNEDYLLKAFALRFLKDRDEESVTDYIESIMSYNGFALLSDISRKQSLTRETLSNFG